MNNFYEEKENNLIKKNNKNMIGLSIFCIFLLCLIVIGIVRPESNKLICKSNRGSITLIYNKESLTAYETNGISYDLESQKKYATKIGIESYLNEFSNWFKTNTAGFCEKK